MLPQLGAVLNKARALGTCIHAAPIRGTGSGITPACSAQAPLLSAEGLFSGEMTAQYTRKGRWYATAMGLWGASVVVVGKDTVVGVSPGFTACDLLIWANLFTSCACFTI